MTLVKAAVCRAFAAPLEIETLTLRPPRAGEVEIEVKACAICHSDITYAEGHWAGPLPALYGHEVAGRVAAVGPGVHHLEPGQRVIATLIRTCGTCPACASGRGVNCLTPTPLSDTPFTDANGQAVAQPLRIGGFAERLVVDQSQVAIVPETLPATTAALLACGVITGVGAAVNAAKLRVGEDVVVIGAGGVGLNAIQGARIAGARRIVAVDMSDEKLADAAAFGATDGVLAGQRAPWEEAARRLGRGADVVLVTVGAAAAYGAAPNYLAPGGRIVAVGMPATGAMAEYEPATLAASGHAIIGSKMGEVVLSRDIPWLVDLYGQGRLRLDELVSRTWPLEEINAAFDDTRSGAARRNVIVFGS